MCIGETDFFLIYFALVNLVHNLICVHHTPFTMVEEDICANAMLYIYKIYRVALAQMSSLAYRPTVDLLE